MIVLGTVLLNATTARFFAKVAGVFLKKAEGILIIGASEPSLVIAKYLKDNGRHVVLIDNNPTHIKKAKELGLEAINTSIYSDSLSDNIELNDVGTILALTANPDINKFAVEKFRNQFGENGAFRLVTVEEMRDAKNNPKEGLFSHTDDYNTLAKAAHDFPTIYEVLLKDSEHYKKLIEITEKDKNIIPLFLKSKNGELEVISAFNKEEANKIEPGWKLVYLGKQLPTLS